MRRLRPLLAVWLLATALAALPAQTGGERFANGLPREPTFFPLGVWLQSPPNAKAFADLGINLYVGLYEGPTQDQLDALDTAGMPVICAQNEVGLAHAGRTIVGWLQPDEPDNAQGRRPFGYAPPILPSAIAAAYERMHRNDPTRPVLLNLGQGAAWDAWHGRGERTGHAEDYPEYVKGCDLVSFDIYPVTHSHRDVQGRLEFVGRGVRRLLAASRGHKPVWACIEASRIDNADVLPTPAQVRSEVWIAICSGASGIVYFVHEFAPKFVEAGLLQHEALAAGVRQLNAEVLAQAPVLHTPIVRDAVEVTTKPKVDLAVRAHRHDGALHLFVASLGPAPTEVHVHVRDQQAGSVQVDGGTGKPFTDGGFTFAIDGYGFVHCRIAR